MALAVEERQAFLAEPHVAALAVNDVAGRGPLTVPIWYQYAPGEDIWIVTTAGSRKARRIAAAGRFSLMVERVRPTVRYVSVEGPVVMIEPGGEAEHLELAMRYLPEEKARAHVAMAVENFGPQEVIHLRPEHWLSADLGPG